MKIGKLSYFIIGLLLVVVVKMGWSIIYAPFFNNLNLSFYTGVLLAYLIPAVVILWLVLILDFVLDKEKINTASLVVKKTIFFLIPYIALSFIFYYFMI